MTEGNKLAELRLGSSYIGQPGINLKREVDLYQGFVQAMKEDIERHPKSDASRRANKITAVTERSIESRPRSAIFLVHGHDGLNLLRLEKLLKEKWDLNPTILMEEPGQGRTIIEKFEFKGNKIMSMQAFFGPENFTNTVEQENA